MADTNIEWATMVWNPGRGCRRTSAGCENCYAERQAIRHAGPGGHYEGLVRSGKNGPRWTGEVRFVPEKLAEPFGWRPPKGGRHRVFVDSMSDLFYEGFTDEQIAAVFGVMAACPQHDFLVLTKRAARARDWFRWLASAPGQSPPAGIVAWAARACALNAGLDVPDVLDAAAESDDPRWPLPNVWLGVSVEDQATAEERIPLLLETPAAVRWVSYEPALGAVDLRRVLAVCSRCGQTYRRRDHGTCDDEGAPGAGHFACGGNVTGLDWVVVGGESGPGARPFDLAWARSTVEACRAAGTPAFVKQLGALPVRDLEVTGNFRTGPAGTRQFEMTAERIVLSDRKGGDPSEWDEDLRVRQFPKVCHG